MSYKSVPNRNEFEEQSLLRLSFPSQNRVKRQRAIGLVQIVGFNTCGGCPGKRAVTRAKAMIQRGAGAIAFASCIAKGTPIGFPCPHFIAMKEAVRRAIGPDIPIIDFTH